jgi:dihydrolipoamide dehydrogenase
VPFDGEQIIDSWGALELEAVPRRLCVIGAGVIGLELGSVWRRLGSEVVMLEALDSLLPMADAQLAAEAARHFRKLGLDIRLGAKVSGATTGSEGVIVRYAAGGSEQSSSSTSWSWPSVAGLTRRTCSARVRRQRR